MAAPTRAASAPDPASSKTAVLEVTRSDNGDATYRLLIDGKAVKLNDYIAKWDDASPWTSGHYDAAFSKLRGRYDAFLIEYPPGRSEIKLHLGTSTGHSEGCIVTKNANILEIERVLAANRIPKNNLKFDVKGDFPIGFKLSVKDSVRDVERGGTITLTLELTGGGAPGGVSKDIWFHLIADTLNTKDFSLVKPETMPQYTRRTIYADTKAGLLFRLPQGARSRDVSIKIASAAHPLSSQPVVFSIDNYKIVNKAPGPPPYFYTPSNYKEALGTTARTLTLTLKTSAVGAVQAPSGSSAPKLRSRL